MSGVAACGVLLVSKWNLVASVVTMYQTRAGYDRGVNTFSPEGRLFQVEYAIKAIELGSCAVGVRTKEGVVLGVEKRVTSPLLEQSSIEKIFELDYSIGAAISGLTADARTLVEHARVEATHHAFVYDEPLQVQSLTQSVCDLMLSFGEGGDERKSRVSRPFGVSLLIAGCDEGVPLLFHADPSGTYVKYDAHAIGNGHEGAQTMLRENYSKEMTLAEAEELVMKVLKETMQDKVTTDNIEVSSVTAEAGYKSYGKAKITELVEAVHRAPGILDDE